MISKIWSPPPELTVSEWSDKNRVLSPESSSEAGIWRTSRAPYQQGIMDAVNDLRKIFPAGKVIKTSVNDFGEETNYINEANVDYTREEVSIFKKLEALYECSRRVSSGISHFIGAVG